MKLLRVFVVVINYSVTLISIFIITITSGKVANSPASSEPRTDVSSNQASESNNSFAQPAQLRNILPDYYFCGQIIGGHYMFGSASSYCGGFTIPDCSAQCFYRNFTFFQCEGFVCHCYTQ